MEQKNKHKKVIVQALFHAIIIIDLKNLVLILTQGYCIALKWKCTSHMDHFYAPFEFLTFIKKAFYKEIPSGD